MTSSSNTYTIFGASLELHNGDYTCNAVKNTFASESSEAYTLMSELVFFNLV